MSKRGQLFTKLGREISVSAREGGADPDGNARLRMAIDRAREANMPMETIQRAIQRGVGGAEGAVAAKKSSTKAYGAGGAAMLIEATTDNRNRTVAEMRAALTRGGGTLGESGSVAWNFESRGVIVAQPGGQGRSRRARPARPSTPARTTSASTATTSRS